MAVVAWLTWPLGAAAEAALDTSVSSQTETPAPPTATATPSGGAAPQDDPIEHHARSLFADGRDAFGAGEYQKAVEIFEKVFALSGKPLMLVNIANARVELGQRRRAAVALRQYLKLVPEAPDRDVIEARIAMLQSGDPAAGAAQPIRLDPPEPSRGLLAGRTWTWIALGGALVFGASSAVFGLDARARYQTLEGGCGTRGGCSDAELSAVSNSAEAANISLGLSLTALAAAISLYFIEDNEEEQSAPRPGSPVVSHATAIRF
ncbi:MAG: hypothetical protein OEZ06_07330 [Myxococcales bacterium]|nr:hypothetical protein [Myxococcales bacterium]